MSRRTVRRFGFAGVVVCCALVGSMAGWGQTAAVSAGTPVGHWVAEHPSKGGIGSWWDFRADGTLTVHFGAMVTSAITRSGDSFTSPPATVDGPAVKSTFRVEGETLHVVSGSSERTFVRVGPAPSASDLLLGKWRPVPPAAPSTDPATAAEEKAMAEALYIFSADGTESVRIPFGAVEGTWDAAAHTFHVQGRDGAFSFEVRDTKLVLGQPPDGHETDTYVVDPIV